MGVQPVNDRSRRRAERNTGLTFDRVLSASNYTWLGRIITPHGHYHVIIDKTTWHTEPDDHCWTSCRELAPSDRPVYHAPTTDKAS